MWHLAHSRGPRRKKDSPLSKNLVAGVIAIGLSAALVAPATAMAEGAPEVAPPVHSTEVGRELAATATAAGALGIDRRADGTAQVLLPRASGSDTTTATPRTYPDGPGRPAATVSRSRFTQQDVDRLMAAVQGMAESQEGKPHGFAFFYDAGEDAIVVETNAPLPMRTALEKRFGDSIVIHGGEVGRSSLQRNVDASPHYGGAAIVDVVAPEKCTAGPAIRIGTNVYSMTANHCGDKEYNGDFWDSPPYVFAVNPGTSSRPPYPTYDFMRINGAGSYSGRIWVGGATTQTSTRVSSAANPCSGCQNYYFSGGTSGTRGGHNIANMSATFCWDGCTPNVVRAESGSATNRAQPGDSGAPMYARASDGSAMIRGLVMGYAYTSTYFEKWSTIQGYYNATIVTG